MNPSLADCIRRDSLEHSFRSPGMESADTIFADALDSFSAPSTPAKHKQHKSVPTSPK